MPLIWKQTLAPGVYSTQTGPFVCTKDDLHHYAETGNAMVKAGLQIPIPEEHQDGAVPMSADEWDARRKAASVRFNKGFVKGFRIRDGVLETLCDIPESGTFNRLTTEIPYVSPEINRRIDGTGKDWGRCITHVALTPIPIWHNQKPFDLADVVPGDGAALMAPVGAPITFAVSPTQLSSLPVDRPIRLSMAQTVVEDKGQWYATRLAWVAAQSRKGTVKAVDSANPKKVLYGKQAEAALNKRAPEGLREAKIGPGFKVSTTKVSPKAKAKSAPKKSAAKAPAKSAPVGITPEQEKSFAEREALRSLPVTKGAEGETGKGYSRKLGKLDVPAFAALAKRIDPDTDLVLNGQAFANARRAYSTWKKAFPRPDEFAKKIEQAWSLDEEQVARGKKRDARGASYAARALAFRHMLQWADEDYAKGKGESGPPEEAGAREYAAKLQKPLAERVQDITTSVDKKGERTQDAEKAQKFFDTLGLALLQHESPFLKIDAQTKSNLARIINTGSKSKEDRDAVQAMTRAALDNYRKHGDEAYPVAKVKKVLEQLSNTGAGTLNPDELRGLLRKQAKGQLSHGATKMAHDPMDDEGGRRQLSEGDESGEGNDELFEEGTEGNETEKEGVSDKIAKVVTELDKLGVKVAADTSDPEEFLAHLVTALQTHHATKGAESGVDEGGASISDKAIEEQPQMGVAMSQMRKEHEARLSLIEAQLADEKAKNLNATIEGLRKSGRITPAKAKAWSDLLGAKRLSLAKADDSDISKVLAQIEVAKENPKGTFWTPEQRVKLSHAHEEQAPEYVDDKAKNGDALDPHVMSKLSGGRYNAKK